MLEQVEYNINLYCKRCKKQTVHNLKRTIQGNNVSLVYLLCERCSIKRTPVTHEVVNEEFNLEIEQIPVNKNNINLKCEVSGCENLGVELHHWAPRNIFNKEAWRWPKSFLCREHHIEWHNNLKSSVPEIN